MPARDLALLTHAARSAGEIALRYWRRSPKAWEKGDQGPVTEADIAVNDMLQAELSGARPGYGWLSEETPDTVSYTHLDVYKRQRQRRSAMPSTRRLWIFP